MIPQPPGLMWHPYSKTSMSVHCVSRAHWMMGLIIIFFFGVWDDDHSLIYKIKNLSHNWVVVEWPEQEEPLLDTWFEATGKQSNARTAVWSNMLVWLEKQWKVIRAIESRLKTSPCAVNNKARQWGNRRLQLSGELEDTGYGRLASKNSIRSNAELYKVPDHKG